MGTRRHRAVLLPAGFSCSTSHPGSLPGFAQDDHSRQPERSWLGQSHGHSCPEHSVGTSAACPRAALGLLCPTRAALLTSAVPSRAEASSPGRWSQYVFVLSSLVREHAPKTGRSAGPMRHSLNSSLSFHLTCPQNKIFSAISGGCNAAVTTE